MALFVALNLYKSYPVTSEDPPLEVTVIVGMEEERGNTVTLFVTIGRMGVAVPVAAQETV